MNSGEMLGVSKIRTESKLKNEMGEAFNIAENRCNNLKEQLDQMKSAYNQKKATKHDLKPDEILEILTNGESLKKRQLPRQNSGTIGTDDSGAAVITINNILSGITNSINRLSELHSSIDNESQLPFGRTTAEKINHSVILEEGRSASKTSIASTHKERKKRIKRRSVMTLEPTALKSVQSVSSQKHRSKEKKPINNSSPIKKRKRLKNKFKLSTQPSIPKLSNNFLHSTRSLPFSSNHLIEIYHNRAAGGSESDEDGNDIKTIQKSSNLQVKPKLKSKIVVPPINVSEDQEEHVINKPLLSPIEENSHEGMYDHEYNCTSHRYEMPTIASKMKQVARGYFRQFSNKTIPFCAAKSTTPSHNIGINIQQVMNIIKNRQHLYGISPTLAHNIGLAANKINPRSISAIVSSFGNKMGYKCFPCPSMKYNVNYRTMQDVAKELPESIEEQNEYDDSQENESIKNQWNGDPGNQDDCICLPSSGAEIQQVRKRIRNGPHDMYILNDKNNNYSKKILRKAHQKYKHIKSVYAQYNNKFASTKLDVFANRNEEGDTMPMKGREKVLKGVLINLHAEFEEMTNAYDELSKSVKQNDNADGDGAKLKELENLEKKLNDKEEEIQMVMALYKEVVNLKQQVRSLREKASFASLVIEQQKNQMINAHVPQNHVGGKPRYKEFKDPTAVLHLTKLLRQIQTQQDICNISGK